MMKAAPIPAIPAFCPALRSASSTAGSSYQLPSPPSVLSSARPWARSRRPSRWGGGPAPRARVCAAPPGPARQLRLGRPSAGLGAGGSAALALPLAPGEDGLDPLLLLALAAPGLLVRHRRFDDGRYRLG